MKYIDLHVHSNFSDGTYTPTELVKYASQKGLAAFALTDHDTTAGLEEALEAARGTTVEVISGIEFSTEFQGQDIHILGLDFDHTASSFQRQVIRFRDSRDLRNRKMIARLAKEEIDISWDSMMDTFGETVWTRAHFARYLMEHGYVSEMNEAFRRFIGDQAPCFIPREKVTPAQAVRLIRQTNGIPVLAHPLLYRLSDENMDTLLQALIPAGLLGIEAIYSTHKGFDESFVRRLARKNHLCICGGSDFHGNNKSEIDLGVGRGNLKIPYDIIKQLRDARRNL